MFCSLLVFWLIVADPFLVTLICASLWELFDRSIKIYFWMNMNELADTTISSHFISLQHSHYCFLYLFCFIFHSLYCWIIYWMASCHTFLFVYSQLLLLLLFLFVLILDDRILVYGLKFLHFKSIQISLVQCSTQCLFGV